MVHSTRVLGSKTKGKRFGIEPGVGLIRTASISPSLSAKQSASDTTAAEAGSGARIASAQDALSIKRLKICRWIKAIHVPTVMHLLGFATKNVLQHELSKVRFYVATISIDHFNPLCHNVRSRLFRQLSFFKAMSKGT